jgi:hypothetical protein
MLINRESKEDRREKNTNNSGQYYRFLLINYYLLRMISLTAFSAVCITLIVNRESNPGRVQNVEEKYRKT